MDEFGVLVESIGFRAGGKSAPLADLKSKTKPSSVNHSKSAYNWNSVNGSLDVDLDGFFGSNNGQKVQSYGGFDDIFGGPIKSSKSSSDDGFDFDGVFKGSNNFGVKNPVSNVYDSDDLFGGMPGLKNTTPVDYDDVFGLNAAPANQRAPIDDLFGNFGLGSNGSKRNSEKVDNGSPDSDDLIPGFSGSSSSRNGENSKTGWSPPSSNISAKPTSLVEDPFNILESSSSKAYTSSGLFSEPVGQAARKSSVLSSVDALEDFASAKVWNSSKGSSGYPKKENGVSGTAVDDLDAIFSKDFQPSNGSKLKSATKDPVYDTLFQKKGDTGAKQTSSVTSSINKKASTQNLVDNFSLLFGGAPSSEEFQEIEGESEERRRARLKHHMRTQQRMAKALEEKNQRDLQTRLEQEERHRIADALDDGIKRWAVGKEGNLRALLSSLHLVLWPECGWQPVSLTDLITSVSVKKVYHIKLPYVSILTRFSRKVPAFSKNILLRRFLIFLRKLGRNSIWRNLNRLLLIFLRSLHWVTIRNFLQN